MSGMILFDTLFCEQYLVFVHGSYLVYEFYTHDILHSRRPILMRNAS